MNWNILFWAAVKMAIICGLGGAGECDVVVASASKLFQLKRLFEIRVKV